MKTSDMEIVGLRELLDRKTIIGLAYLQANFDRVVSFVFYKKCVEIVLRKSLTDLEFSELLSTPTQFKEILKGFYERESGALK